MTEFDDNSLNQNDNHGMNNPNQYNVQNQYTNPNQYANPNQYGNPNQNGNPNQYGDPNQYSRQNPYQNQYNGQNPYNKVPEYSFWAEQIPSNPYLNNSQNNAGQYSSDMADRNTMNQMNAAASAPESKKKKRGGKVLKFLAKAVCFGLIAGVSFLGFQKLFYLVYPDAVSGSLLTKIEQETGISTDQNYEVGYTDTGSVKVEDTTAISSLTKSTIPAIVSINSTSTQISEWFGQPFDQQVEGSGSGIIVQKNDKELLIATNNHVVEGANKITVTFTDGTEAEATVKGADATADLAVVTVDVTKLKDTTLSAIAVAKLGNSDDVKVGQMAIAIGNALGYGQSVTVGFISAKDREVDVSDGYDTSKKMVLLQTDAAINPGNSGGALLNLNGEVIGINTVKYASNEVEGMGYAIPISKATPIITELMNREVLSPEEQGYLGISGYDVTEEVSTYYNIPIGVYVAEVPEGGAAEKAGIKADDIITKVNDIDITSITQLKDKVNSLKVGTKVQITYMRNSDGEYKATTVDVTLGKNPTLSSETDNK